VQGSHGVVVGVQGSVMLRRVGVEITAESCDVAVLAITLSGRRRALERSLVVTGTLFSRASVLIRSTGSSVLPVPPNCPMRCCNYVLCV